MKKFEFAIWEAQDIHKYQRQIGSMRHWHGLSSEKKPDNYVWDEDESVRWNRMKTEEYNDAIDKKIEDAKAEYQQAVEALDNAVADYIIEDLKMNDVELSREKAVILWHWLENEHDSDAANWLNSYLDILAKVLS